MTRVDIEIRGQALEALEAIAKRDSSSLGQALALSIATHAAIIREYETGSLILVRRPRWFGLSATWRQMILPGWT